MAAATRSRRRGKPPLEYSILYTATLCLLAAGAVMVYSASSAASLLKNGDPAFFLKRYVLFGAIGLIVMHAISRGGLRVIRRLTPLLVGVTHLSDPSIRMREFDGVTPQGEILHAALTRGFGVQFSDPADGKLELLDAKGQVLQSVTPQTDFVGILLDDGRIAKARIT